jgi:hypothetical protein
MAAPTLPSLPSEIRREIVSYLVVTKYVNFQHKLGSKADLKNANAAHSCLREWVPEYMFRDMVFNNVVDGMISHLERFIAEPANSRLWPYVKTIYVQVCHVIRS